MASQSPGEIKRREVSWNLTKKTLICGSRRDQEEGGELDSHEEDSFAGPGEIKRREVSWTLTKKLDSHLRVQARKKR